MNTNLTYKFQADFVDTLWGQSFDTEKLELLF